ncbi:Uncharacterised protein [Segatella copri]|nr:Uncharacterised protein [Segatella copri]
MLGNHSVLFWERIKSGITCEHAIAVNKLRLWSRYLLGKSCGSCSQHHH